MTFIHWWNILPAHETHQHAVFWKSESLCSSSMEKQELPSCSSCVTASLRPPVTHPQAAVCRRKHPSLRRSCHSHLWQAASLCRMFNLFHGSRRGCSQESTPECFMSPSQWQEVMMRHVKLAGGGASQKRGPRDEWWRLTERQRWRCLEGAVMGVDLISTAVWCLLGV